MEFVGFDEAVRFTARGGETVSIEAGLYRVEAAGDGQLAFTREDGTATLVEAAAGGHPLALEAPLTVAFDAGKGDRRVAVLLPGGLALVAGGARTTAGEAARETLFSSAGFADAMLHHHLPLGDMIRHRPDYWHTLARFGFGTIEPSTSPTPIAPMTLPPHWVRTTVVTCYVPPAGSYGAGGPGTASGVPPFPPGSHREARAVPRLPGLDDAGARDVFGEHGGESGGATRHGARGEHRYPDDSVDDVGGRLPHRARGRRPHRFPRRHRRHRARALRAAAAGNDVGGAGAGRLASTTGFGVPIEFDLVLGMGTGSRPGRWATTPATPAGRHRRSN